MIRQLISNISMLLRVIKNMLLRPFRLVGSKVMSYFAMSRILNKLPGVAQKLPKILKTKPEKREDYFDWGTIYVAKSLVIIVAVLLVAIPLLIIFVIAPLFTRWFGVKEFQKDDMTLSNYSGKVCVYYDEGFEQLRFEGKVKKGLAIEYGEEYYENGRIQYAGNFEANEYSGNGISYYEDGSVKYRGVFLNGEYHGQGEYINEEKVKFVGTFENGSLNGRGTMLKNDVIVYEGNFSDGQLSGEGRILYNDGTVQYSGMFSGGKLNGSGMEFYKDGTLKYNGSFVTGLYDGNGVLYSSDGAKLYSGDFELGKYSGEGTLYGENGKKLYSGEFEAGEYSGSGVLSSADGHVTEGNFALGELSGTATRTYPNGLKYIGAISDDMLNGNGSLTETVGNFGYTGPFVDDDIDYAALLKLDSNEVKELFTSELTQKVDSDCFYLSSDNYGLTIKCRFAEAGGKTSVTEIASLPRLSEGAVISKDSDIDAPNAAKKGESDARLSGWISEKYGISADSVDCWSAEYAGVRVYYWTDKETGKLVLKSAVPRGSGAARPDDSSEELSGLAREDIIKLFEDLGLDIEDFESLGF